MVGFREFFMSPKEKRPKLSQGATFSLGEKPLNCFKE